MGAIQLISQGGQYMASQILQYFTYNHLLPLQREISKPFGELAEKIDALPDSAEKSAGLRKLLEAKDCIVRASLPLL